MLSIEYYFKTYFLQLCTFAFPWVNSEEIAKDIVQDAFIVLMDRPELLEKGERVSLHFGKKYSNECQTARYRT